MLHTGFGSYRVLYLVNGLALCLSVSYCPGSSDKEENCKSVCLLFIQVLNSTSMCLREGGHGQEQTQGQILSEMAFW